jgi:hypothetical protein
VYDHQDPAQGIHAWRDKPLLTLDIRIRDRQRVWIAQGLFGIGKGDTVLAQIRFGFCGIKFEIIHLSIMHIICILSRPPIANNLALRVATKLLADLALKARLRALLVAGDPEQSFN